MKTKLLAAICAVLSFASPLAGATFDYFLKLEGIDGESTDAAYPGAIELESFNWGLQYIPDTSTANGGGGGAGKVVFQDVHFVAKMSKASPKLMLACATGQHFPNATIIVRKAGTLEPYMQMTLENVLLSSISSRATRGTSTQAGTSDDRPTEEVAFYYNKVTFTHVGDDGTVTTATAEVTPEEEAPLR